jgi:serine protease Do
LKPGDVIRKFNGRLVNDSSDLLAAIASTNPGTPATLEILRNGKPETVKVTLEQRPADLSYAGGARRSLNEGALRGIVVQNLTEPLRKQLGIPPDVHGVVITDLSPDSPAAQFLEQGDVILSINHHEVKSVTDFNRLAAEAKGQTLLRVLHQGEAAFVVIPAESGSER